MIDSNDIDLVTRVNNLLTDEGLNVNRAAKRLGFSNPNTLYQKLYRMGYKIENSSKLVPINAPALPTPGPEVPA